MSDQLKAEITERLNTLVDPYTQMGFAANKSLKAIEINETKIRLSLSKGYPIKGVKEELIKLIESNIKELELGGLDLEVSIEQAIIAHAASHKAQKVAGIKNIIAVASGKGGVGKSTVTANLALALAQAGANVAILDADIYGPSQPRMMGVSSKPEALPDKKLKPIFQYDMKLMSIGFLVEEDTPMIWRGPMATQALEQMLRGTAWVQEGEEKIDYLLIDLPPGTGDIQLTLSQKVPVTGAIIVSTPQDIALLDARKAYKMFDKVEVPVLGLIENMSTHICSQCGHEEAIFGHQGVEKMAEDYDLDVLGSIPLDKGIRADADSGKPTVASSPDSQIAAQYKHIALTAAGKLANKKSGFNATFPEIVVERS